MLTITIVGIYNIITIVLILLIETIKCIDHDNLIVTENLDNTPNFDRNDYVIALDRDVIDMTQMTKKPYHESLLSHYFSQFIYMHKKKYYTSEVFNYHLKVFSDNVKYINKLNEKFKGVTVFAVNKYTDQTYENFIKWNTGFSLSKANQVKLGRYRLFVTKNSYANAKNVTNLDRTLHPVHGYVEKNQGNCSNSYVFAAVRMMELGYRLQVSDYLGRLVLSDQHAFDCTPAGDCNGNAASGHVFEALFNTGIMLSDDYPYDETNPKKGSCKYDPSKFSVKYSSVLYCTDFTLVTEDELIGVVWVRAAFATSMFVPRSMQHYKAGLLIPTDCQDQAANHMVVIAGYGTTSNGVKYWTAYNSWGMSWGEYGRFHIVRGVFACRITQDYISYARFFKDEFPPFQPRDKWFQDVNMDNREIKTGETFTMDNFNYNTKPSTNQSTTRTYVPWFVTTGKFTLNSSMIISSTTAVPDNDDGTRPTRIYARPRAQTNFISNRYISIAFDKWYQLHPKTQSHTVRTGEILDSEYLRTSSVLTTPASWEAASHIDYSMLEPEKEESDSFYVP